ncbi:MAG: autotransporter outer membrane beta-barrel domain-containing protein [Synergistaceae bacterium]|nr:autotransporter outer membrane beta-barrel domain-containing protein [Synergistaceae bacterium]
MGDPTKKGIGGGASTSTGAAADMAKTIYFCKQGEKSLLWRVLSTNETITAGAGTRVLLLSDKSLVTSAFDSNGKNAWSGSEVRELLLYVEAAFDEREQAQIAETQLTDVETGGTSDHLFLLSNEEVAGKTDKSKSYGFTDGLSRIATGAGAYGAWWLRSPGSEDSYAFGVDSAGTVGETKVFNKGLAVRPAFNLNPESVLFLSAAVGGKGAEACVGKFGIDNTYDGKDGWKVTLRDPNINKPTVIEAKVVGAKWDVNDLAAEATKEGGSKVINISKQTPTGDVGLKISYSGATPDEDTKGGRKNMYVSALLKDGDTFVNYAKVNAITSATETSGNKLVDITNVMPKSGSKDYTLYIYGEQENGDKNTDYASSFSVHTVTIPAKVPAEVITVLSHAKYGASGLTANLSNNCELGFEGGKYDTKIIVGEGEKGKITADKNGTTLTGDVTLGNKAVLTMGGKFTLENNLFKLQSDLAQDKAGKIEAEDLTISGNLKIQFMNDPIFATGTESVMGKKIPILTVTNGIDASEMNKIIGLPTRVTKGIFTPTLALGGDQTIYLTGFTFGIDRRYQLVKGSAWQSGSPIPYGSVVEKDTDGKLYTYKVKTGVGPWGRVGRGLDDVTDENKKTEYYKWGETTLEVTDAETADITVTYNKTNLAPGTKHKTSFDGSYTAYVGLYDATENGGGAVYNETEYKEEVKADFIRNFVIKGLNVAYGGAIYNDDKLNAVTGDFIGNYASSTGTSAYGGAICNWFNKGTIEAITGDFIGNYARGTSFLGPLIDTCASGGAIHNNGGSTINNIIGDFIGNYALSMAEGVAACGGAIGNRGTINSLTGNFIGNYVSAEDVSVTTRGGAIYNEGNITISAKNVDIKFSGNTASEGGAIYNNTDGTLKLYAASGKSITFVGRADNQTVDSVHNISNLYINNTDREDGSYTGTINLATVTGANGKIYINGGTVNLHGAVTQQEIENNAFLNLEKGSTLASNITMKEGSKGVTNFNTDFTVGENQKITQDTINIGDAGKSATVTTNIDNLNASSIKVGSAGVLNLTSGMIGKAIANSGTVAAKSGAVVNSTITNTPATGKVKLEKDSSFGASGKVTGGELVFEEGTEFKPANIENIKNLTSNGAKLNFAAKIVDEDGGKAIFENGRMLNVVGKATGQLNLHDINLTGVDPAAWLPYEENKKQMQYLSASVISATGTDMTIANSLTAVLGNTGTSFTFKQAVDGTGKKIIGWMDVIAGNSYTLSEVIAGDTWEKDGKDYDGKTHKAGELINATDSAYARGVNVYTLQDSGNNTYIASRGLGQLKCAEDTASASRTMIIKSGANGKGTVKQMKFYGTGATPTRSDDRGGLIIGDTSKPTQTQEVEVQNVAEIAKWKDHKAFTVNSNGELSFSGEDVNLTLLDGIVNNDGGTVTFNQNTILKFADDDVSKAGKLSGAGSYINKRTMTIADMAKLDVSELTNKGIVNLEDNGTLGVKIAGGTFNIKENVTSQADKIAGDTNTIAASKTLTITSGTLARAVSGDGTVKFTGGDIAADVTSKVLEIAGHVTAKADNIKGTTNKITSGTLKLTSGIVLNGQVTGNGTLEFATDIRTNVANVAADTNMVDSGVTLTLTGTDTATGTLNKVISGEGNLVVDGTVSSGVANFANSGALSVRSGTLELTSGTLTKAIDNAGTVKLAGANLGGAYVTKGTLEFAQSISTNASYVAAATNRVDSGVTLTLTGTDTATGTLSKVINGDGNLVVDGTVSSDVANLANSGALSVRSGTLELTSGTLTRAIDNAGTVKLAGANLDGTYVTKGMLEFASNLVTNASYVAAVTNLVDSGVTLTLNEGTLAKAVMGDGTVKFTGGELAADVTSSQLVFAGDVTANADKIQGIISNKVTSGTLELISGTLTTALANSSKVTMQNGVKLNSTVTNETATASTKLASGASFGVNGKVTGGELVFEEGTEFKPANIENIKNLTSNGAKLNFAAKIVDEDGGKAIFENGRMLNVVGKATGQLNLHDINLTGVDPAAWLPYEENKKQMQYLSASVISATGTDMTIANSLTAVLGNTGTSFTFKQAVDGTGKKIIGWMDVIAGNSYTLSEVIAGDTWEKDGKDYDGKTHKAGELINATDSAYARGVNVYTLQDSGNNTYIASRGLGQLKCAEDTASASRSMIIKSGTNDDGTIKQMKFYGTGAAVTSNEDRGGLIIGDTSKPQQTQNVEVQNIAEIAKWKDHKAFTVNSNGELSFNGEDVKLTLLDGIVNNDGGTVTFNQNTILKFADEDTKKAGILSGKGSYINNAIMTVTDAAKLAMTGQKGLENIGTLILTGGTLAKGVTVTGTGLTLIDGIVKSDTKIANMITINPDKSLEISADNVGGKVTNNEGTLILNGGTLSQQVNTALEGQIGTIDLQAATEIAAKVKNQNIKATKGYSKVSVESYIANNDLTFNGGGFDFRDDKVSNYVVKNINLTDNGNLKLDVDLANKLMDTLNVADGGGVTGTGKLHVTALTLLSDAKQNKTNIAFTETDALKGHVVSDVTHVASDMWKYLVAYDEETGEFAFTKNGRNEPDKPEVSETVMSVSDTANAINLAWLETTNTLQKRLGDLRGGEASNTGWARFQRSNDDHKGARKLNVSGNLYQLGYDVALKNITAARGYFGLSLEHFDGSQSYKIGGGDVKSTSLSAYYTKIYDSGHYFDFIFRYGRYESDTTSYDAGLSTKLDYGMNGVTLSGEYGYRANIGKNGFYFEPQAEVIYGYLAGAKKTSSRGILADIDSTNHFVTRLGVALGKKVKNFNYYLRGSYYHDFAGSTNILYGDASYKQDSARNWWELSLGGGWNMTDASYFYAELTKHFKDVSNSINFNLGFRFTL